MQRIHVRAYQPEHSLRYSKGHADSQAGDVAVAKGMKARIKAVSIYGSQLKRSGRCESRGHFIFPLFPRRNKRSLSGKCRIGNIVSVFREAHEIKISRVSPRLVRWAQSIGTTFIIGFKSRSTDRFCANNSRRFPNGTTRAPQWHHGSAKIQTTKRDRFTSQCGWILVTLNFFYQSTYDGPLCPLLSFFRLQLSPNAS